MTFSLLCRHLPRVIGAVALGLGIVPAQAGDAAKTAVTGIGYTPSLSDPDRGVAGGAGDLEHPMTLSYGTDVTGVGSTSTAVGPFGAFADDVGGGDGGLPGRHRLHGSITAFVGNRGMAGTGVEMHTPSIGNTGIAASVSVAAAHLPSLKVPGGGHVDGGNTQSASIALAKQFDDGTQLGLSFGYARLGNSPYGPYGLYGLPYRGIP